MNQKEFDEVVRQTIDAIQELLVIKGGEYAGSEDRLANFKRGSALTGVLPLTVCMIYLSKHYDAISTYVRNSQLGNTNRLSEPIEGRLDDLINYCILMKAIIRESQFVPIGKSTDFSHQAVREILHDAAHNPITHNIIIR